MKKQSKSAKIRELIGKGLENIEIAKKLQVSLNLVHQVRHSMNKKVKAAQKKPSKIIKAVKEVKSALDSLDKDKPFSVYKIVPKVTTRPLTRAEIGALGADIADRVNNPPHYNTGKIETITFIEDKDLNYRLGNVVKYVTRAGKKVGSDPVEDLKKARWYLDREINVRENA